MNGEPPPYPRIAHLAPGRGTTDDLVLGPAEVTDLLSTDVVVEEKVDGANVAIWLEGFELRAALRAGVGAMDRAGQLGPLRAWVGVHGHELRSALDDDTALYGEWLMLSHTLVYDRLPSYLVVLDFWHRGQGFLPPAERDERAAAAGLVIPPRIWSGIAKETARLEQLFGPSAWSSSPMEGLIVRRAAGGEPRLAKLLRLGFARLTDDAWRRGRPRNRLVSGRKIGEKVLGRDQPARDGRPSS